MAFEKQQKMSQQRERFDLYNSKDKEEILNFEKELKPYLERNYSVFGKTLNGFELYLHERELFHYTTKYLKGAVVLRNLEEYRIAGMKYRALTELWGKRKKAQERESERVQTLIPIEATA